ncbi:deoxyribonuclease TatD [Neoasaia chiangmaiensis NBRC 101099]|uniref:LuxR family transcriptional regulator n=1 Tax=Neoasaia chiangmaiensis TaxID=320497 RepID=A0A1U9KMN3_9PROT|nr:TatD family hydrolase [Neoasaia chiangmaiensis]AQS87043.1 LuxR family transcriptional regulator [Neoasaia chiangmaiensis]GBR37911.1 deoxyribonuclease TatD [Neoasaia chiangmaiensis NBRC 101099]GEN15181.1 LuxR family transcriptional regulator [Neoasaia chiangmaiensis]
MLIDSHCHLDRLVDVAAALGEAREAGVGGMVTIGTRLSQAAIQIGLTGYDTPELRVWCAIGTHPDHAHEEPLPTAERIAELTTPSHVIGIGESGLDYFHGGEDVRDIQIASFRAHITAARLTGLPLVIHARQADDDVMAILRDEHERNGAFPFLLHCFASGTALAETAIDLGGYISFSGLLTFPKCDEIRAVARQVPRERLLVETDSPFLAPVPKRGKPNMPGYVAYTAARLAAERSIEPQALADLTTANFFRLFRRAA